MPRIGALRRAEVRLAAAIATDYVPIEIIYRLGRSFVVHLLSAEAFSGYSVANCASPQRESVRHTHHRRRNSPRIAQVSDTARDFVDLFVVMQISDTALWRDSWLVHERRRCT